MPRKTPVNSLPGPKLLYPRVRSGRSRRTRRRRRLGIGLAIGLVASLVSAFTLVSLYKRTSPVAPPRGLQTGIFLACCLCAGLIGLVLLLVRPRTRRTRGRDEID